MLSAHPNFSIPTITAFRQLIWNFYKKNRRSFAWRTTTDPYAIVVSEIMLQQTQTDRVAKKFPEFMTTFPMFAALAQAPLSEVIRAWQGLGYNRRAIALQKIAQRVHNEYNGSLPRDPEILQTFPGIGPNTAGSIVAFAWNLPTIFIETNIRAVFLHHFFPNQEQVSDRELLPLISAVLDQESPREWYYALMDYGVYLKKAHKNPSRRSAHHTKQSKFTGSDRQIRGAILRHLLKEKIASFAQLERAFPDCLPIRLERILTHLITDTFLVNTDGIFRLR